MDRITARMPAEVAIECRTDVIELVENGNQLLFKCLIEKTRQAEGEKIEHLTAIHKKPLHLILGRTMPTSQRTVPEP